MLSDYDTIQKTLKQYGQEHLLTFYSELPPDRQRKLLEDISSVPFSSYFNTLEKALKCERESFSPTPLMPNSDTKSYSYYLEDQTSPEKLKAWRDHGLSMIRKSQVAILLLAGGQGTRLGWEEPKGTYPIGAISKKCLFQIYAEKYLKIIDLAKKDSTEVNVPFYVMTADHNEAFTQQFFEKNQYFGIKKENVYIFKQDSIPAIDMSKKILLSQKDELFRNPTGNGGIFTSPEFFDVIKDMEKKNILLVHIVAIDNPLQKVLDPLFLGYTNMMSGDIGVCAIKRVDPDESIGLLCAKGEKCVIIEYSDLSDTLRYKKNQDGAWSLSAGNICNYIVSLDFLKIYNTMDGMEEAFVPHIAKKKIPHIDLQTGQITKPSAPNGMKMEYLVFDIFELSRKTTVLEIDSKKCFLPLKNAEGDCSPEACREAVSQLHKTWLEKVGAKLEGEGRLEISPLVSYEGEGLEKYAGKTVKLPMYIK